MFILKIHFFETSLETLQDHQLVDHGFHLLNNSPLATTLTDDKAIATTEIIGENKKPYAG